MVQILNPYDLPFNEVSKKIFLQEKESILLSTDKSALSYFKQIDSEPLLWLSSSGSSQKKFIALSARALKNSAESANQFLDISASDCWAIALPLQHIASVSVFYRSLLSGCRISFFESRWNAEEFCKFLDNSEASICSLVPTQIFDIVQKSLSPSKKLRLTLVGGAKLDPQLYRRARELGWPVLPSYGLTECSSLVACANINSLDSTDYPELQVLAHLHLRIDYNQQIVIRGSSLLSKSLTLEESNITSIQSYDPDSELLTSDLGSLNNNTLQIYGRSDRNIKIRGSFVNLQSYEDLAYSFFKEQQIQGSAIFSAVAVPDLRAGYKVFIFHNQSESDTHSLKDQFNLFLNSKQQKIPAVDRFVAMNNLPRLENGKINYNQIQIIAEQDNQHG